MRTLLQYLLKRPLLWLANRFSAAPKKEVVFKSLTDLYASAEIDTRVKFIVTDLQEAKFIIFSDQHKGDKSAADDFKNNEANYLGALQYYNENKFSLINLGDSEELWKFKAANILPANKKTLQSEAAFQPDRLYKTYGNHDLIWKNKADVFFLLRNYFTMPLNVHEGIVIKLKCASAFLNVFLTHGHQGDAMSDNNWFSTWLVAHIWMPMQRFLRINVNTPSKDYSLRNKHNIMMSEWSGLQQNILLITGHTHVPVFASGRYFNHPSNNIDGVEQSNIKPSYFNTGCCCFSDGDITGIEIEDGCIRLIKWHEENGSFARVILEENSIEKLLLDINISSN
jgi:UDP-2,3-diacylglucosamine pyrophosphatase LpxH